MLSIDLQEANIGWILTSVIPKDHWRSITVLLAFTDYHKFFDYALLMAYRDMIFDMYTNITTRNDIRYMYTD